MHIPRNQCKQPFVSGILLILLILFHTRNTNQFNVRTVELNLITVLVLIHTHTTQHNTRLIQMAEQMEQIVV